MESLFTIVVSHTGTMGVLWQIFVGAFYNPTARNASPPGYKKPPQKFATERPIVPVCKVETGYRLRHRIIFY